MVDWNRIRYFKPWEFADPQESGSGELISFRVVTMLDWLREDTGLMIITHWSVGGCVDVNGTHGHAKNSYHLARMGACAVDFHFEDAYNSVPGLREQYALIAKVGFHGIGFYPSDATYRYKYPYWWHVDDRPREKTQRWKRILGKYFYLLED